ncbi:M14 family metallocarboxypeptidase [Verrucomicrobia bacterium]|nr:M14 family metallocarboxypeptidase [Verrucomicrobiota bacterium]
MAPKPKGLNKSGYCGERVDVDSLIARMIVSAEKHGWEKHWLEVPERECLPWFIRAADDDAPWVYLSAGVHGDEPAPLLAVLQLLEEDLFPLGVSVVLIPCLNPEGFRMNSRFSGEGVDLNRAYRKDSSVPVVRAHQEILTTFPPFDFALCLHEDWEASGFYIYEVNIGKQISPVVEIIQKLKSICPVDEHVEIDGRPAVDGVIRPTIPNEERKEWPEALYLVEHNTLFNLTIESPSDFEMSVRVDLQVQVVCEFLKRAPLLFVAGD